MASERMTVETMRRRALQRAISLGLAGEVVRVKRDWYRVPSSSTPGQTYTVRVVEGRYTCSCQAGRSGRACSHQAAVYVARLEHNSGVRVVWPSTPAPTPSNVITFKRRAAA